MYLLYQVSYESTCCNKLPTAFVIVTIRSQLIYDSKLTKLLLK